jgi:uncharacterized membrane protein
VKLATLTGLIKPLLAGAVIVLPFLVNRALSGPCPPRVAALLVSLQVFTLALVFSVRLASIWRGVVAIGAAGLAGLLAFHWGRAGLSLSGGLTHASINILLFGFFSATLAPGREPLIAAMARHIHGGELPLELQRHARLVTKIWCAFFLGQVAVSILLYALAPLPVWSFFITILNPILLVAMFVVEIIYRRWRYRHLPQSHLRHFIRIGSAWRAIAKPAAAEMEGSS